MRKLLYTLYTEDVEEYILDLNIGNVRRKGKGRLLHLTPTMFLYRRRFNRLKYLLNKENLKGLGSNDAQLDQLTELNQFDHWARELVYGADGQFPLSRSETHVLIRRAIEEKVAGRKDWMSVSFELLELFLELDSTGISIVELEEISPYSDWSTIIQIYEAYLALLREADQQSYNERLLELIKESTLLDQFDEVVFDGPFLFLTAIHEAVINRFERDGKDITFIVPYQKGIDSINPAFNVIQKAYAPYVPITEWKPIGKLFQTDSTDLEQLRNVLFTDEYIRDNSKSFTINSHGTLEEEIRHVIQCAKQVIESGETNHRGIIIVTPNAMQLRPLVREIAEQEDLPVEIPSRPLLGLTSGEFIHLIYRSKWDEKRFEEATYFDSSMFKRILDSGWFTGAQTTLHGFQAVEETFFTNCLSIEEWLNKITQLRYVKVELEHEELTYHPLHGVLSSDLMLWETILNEIQSAHVLLTQGKPSSLNHHAMALMEVLEKIASTYGFIETEYGLNVMNRLNKIVSGIATQNRLPVNTKEFSGLIHQLMVEEEQSGEENERDQKKPDVLVTGPENVAFLEYKYLFMIQFTQDSFPQLPKSTWPNHHDLEWKLLGKTTSLYLHSTEEWEQLLADREKYYFYLTFYVPKTEMHISYSRTLTGERAYPSHYLYDLARTYKLEESTRNDGVESASQSKTIEELLESHGLLNIHRVLNMKMDTNAPVAVTPHFIEDLDRLTIDELGLYRLCPKRFYYMKNNPEQSLYKTGFQLERYIAAVITERAAVKLFSQLSKEPMMEQLETMKKRNQVLFQTLPTVLEAVGHELKRLFPVDRQIWEQGAYYGKRFVENMIKKAFDEKQAKVVLKGGTPQLKASFNVDYTTEVEQIIGLTRSYLVLGKRPLSARFGSVTRNFFLSHYSHMPGISSYELSDSDDGIELFSEWFYRFRRRFFTKEIGVKEELTEIIRDIEAGTFPKTAGDHCSYCPFLMTCQKSAITEVAQEE